MKFELPPPLPDEATIQRQRRLRANKAELEQHSNGAGSIHNRTDPSSMRASPSGDLPEAHDHTPLPSSNAGKRQTNRSRTNHSGTDWSFLRENAKAWDSSEAIDWSFLHEKGEESTNSKNVPATPKKRQHAVTALVVVGALTIAVLCWLISENSRKSASTSESSEAAQGNLEPSAPKNPSVAAASPASSPNSDGSTQPGTQAAGTVASVPTPSLASSPNSDASAQQSAQPTETVASVARPSPASSPNSDGGAQPGAQLAGTVASVASPSPASSPHSKTNVQRGSHPTTAKRPNSEEGSSSTTISSGSPTPTPSVITSPSPAPKVTKAATPRSAPALRRGAMIYEVVGIPNGDYLNVRSGAGSTYPIIGRLAPGTGEISSTAAAVKNGETTWLRISVGNLSGWVNSDFLKPAGGKGASPPQTGQESTAQSQASVTPLGSEAEQRARYWAAQGYKFDPQVMSAYSMDQKVKDIERAKYWAEQGYYFDPQIMTAYSMDEKVKDIERAKYWAEQGYHFDPQIMTAYSMDEKVKDIERAKYWAEQGYHFDPQIMTAYSMDQEVERMKRSQQ
jgi:uncharacterized protein YraI